MDQPPKESRVRLLFITQKIHERDDDLAFAILWIKQFEREGFDVSVICLESGEFDGSFPVYSLGKERGVGKLGRALRFLALIATLDYDRVFVHMNPEYFTLGGWWWALTRTPAYFWYTHYTLSFHVRLAGLLARRLFAATAQSLPQYEGNAKKVVLGHGIDVAFWDAPPELPRPDAHRLIAVHRLSRSKRLEQGLRTLALLPDAYSLAVYGRAIDPPYYEELRNLVRALGLGARVTFEGPVPMQELRSVYPRHRLMLNMAYETIDKTMLEGMLYGVYPVTTPRNARAIGLPVFPEDETPEALAAFIEGGAWERIGKGELRRIVEERHGLTALVARMAAYLRSGT